MKLNKISLQNLSQAEMAKKEQNLLRGGVGDEKRCPCMAACMCTGYTTAESGYYEGSNMMKLNDDEATPVANSNHTSYNSSNYSY